MGTAWLSITVTISIFVLSHIVITVWWASKVNTMLNYVHLNLTDLVQELKIMKESYAKKEDLIILNKEKEAIWKRIDLIQEKLATSR